MPVLPTRRTLTLAAAKLIAEASQAEAERNGWKVTIAIVDDGGHLMHLVRLDGAHLASAETAAGKARTAAMFRRPTKGLEDSINKGRFAFLDAPNIVPLEGGVPVVVEGDVVGAVGVSGVQSSQDVQIAEAGIAALMAR
jgi:uncharacterized protein GlcG (DUF336 family)